METENTIPASIWDGWEKQSFHFELITADGRTCAIGWPLYNRHRNSVVGSGESETYHRVAAYLRQKFDLIGEVCTRASNGAVQTLNMWNDGDVVIYANNALRLTPERFREIDRETQIAEALASIEAQIEEVVYGDGLTEMIPA